MNAQLGYDIYERQQDGSYMKVGSTPPVPPNDPAYQQLIQMAQQSGGRIAITDSGGSTDILTGQQVQAGGQAPQDLGGQAAHIQQGMQNGTVQPVGQQMASPGPQGMGPASQGLHNGESAAMQEMLPGQGVPQSGTMYPAQDPLLQGQPGQPPMGPPLPPGM